MGIVGLGQVGSTLYEHISQYHTIWGIDTNLPSRGSPNNRPDVLHFAIPDRSRGATTFISAVLEYVRKYEPKLIILESSIHVGTTRFLQQRLPSPIIHSPFRGNVKDGMGWGLRTYTKICGAVNREDAEKAARYYQGMDLKTRILNSPEESELAKLCEVGYYGIMLGFWQDAKRWCDEKDADFEAVQDFATSVTRESAYKHLRPKFAVDPNGIGGHCVVPDLEILDEQFGNFLPHAVLASNRRQIEDSLPSADRRVKIPSTS